VIRSNALQRLSDLLGLPTDVIRAYVRPRASALGSRPQGNRRHESQRKPRSSLRTIRGTTDSFSTEEIKTSSAEKRENELYERWSAALDEQRPDLERQLFKAVLRHAEAVIWLKLPERNGNLANSVASDTIKNLSLGKFQKRSKFSTWVQGIAKNKIKEKLKKRKTANRRFSAFDDENPEDTFEDPSQRAAFGKAEKRLFLDNLRKGLRPKDQILLDCKLEELTSAECAARLGLSENAAESQWRRLRGRLRKKYSKFV
jgi:RNA polymerase sigma factor (sigma-70 family)